MSSATSSTDQCASRARSLEKPSGKTPWSWMPRNLSWILLVVLLVVSEQVYGQISDVPIPKHCCNGSLKMICASYEQDVTLLRNGQVENQPQKAIPVEFHTDALLPNQTQQRSVTLHSFNAQLKAMGYIALFIIADTAVEIQGCILTVVKRPFSVWAGSKFLNAPAQFQSGCIYQVTQCPMTSLRLQEPQLTPTKLEPVPESTRLTESGGADFHFRIADPLSPVELQNVRYQLAITGTVHNGSGAADMVHPPSGVGIQTNSTELIVTIPRISAPETVLVLVKFRKVVLRWQGPLTWQGLPSEYLLRINAAEMPRAESTVPASVSTPTAASPSNSSTPPTSDGTSNGSATSGIVIGMAILAAVVLLSGLILLSILGRKCLRDRQASRARPVVAVVDSEAHELHPAVNALPSAQPNGASENPPAYSLEELPRPANQGRRQAPAPLPPTTSPPTPPPPPPQPLPTVIQSNSPSGSATNQEAASSGVPISEEESHKHPEDHPRGIIVQEEGTGNGELLPSAGLPKVDLPGGQIVPRGAEPRAAIGTPV